MAEGNLNHGDLLFFDTFSHENTEELNLDLVQFPRPVLVHEVRVIPLGTRVQVNVPGGERLGATNPSSFKLEFFVNNLGRPNAAVFEKLGILDYKKNVEIQFKPTEDVPTDGLILKGWYNTITLAVYGSLTSVTKDRNSPPPPPPPQQPSGRSKPTEGRSTDWEPPREPRQHPLDFMTQITKQATLQQQKQAVHPEVHISQPHSTAPHPDLYPALSSTNTLPKQDYGRPPGEALDPRERDREMRDVTGARDSAPHRDYRGPPEPREPYTSPYYEERKTKEFDRGYYRGDKERERRDSISSPESDYHGKFSNSREGSREPREFRGGKPRDDSDREWSDKSKDFIDRDSKDRARTPPSRRMTPPRSRSRSPIRRSPERRTPPARSPHRQSPIRDSPLLEEKPKDSGMEESLEAGIDENGDEMFEQLTPEHSPIEQMYLSDGAQEGDDPYETISSDEDMGLTEMDGDINAAVGFYDDDSWNFAISSFNPFQCDLAPLDTFYDPSLTKYEIEALKWEQMSSSEINAPPKTAISLLEIYTELQDAEHHNKWVEALEGVPDLLNEGLSYIQHTDEKSGLLDSLLNWTMEALNKTKAIEQPDAVFKVRHLKMGIRLAGSLVSCDPSISEKLISRNIQKVLIDLFEESFMSVSLKIQILQTLDQTTRFKEGIDWLLGKHELQSETKNSGEQQATGYQRLLDLIMSKQTVRCTVAITALLRKIHLYAVMTKLNQATEHVVKHMSSRDEERGVVEGVVQNMSIDEEGPKTDIGEDLEPDSSMGGTLNEADVHTLTLCLEEVTKVLALAPKIIGQPRRSLPRTSVFEVKHSPPDPYPNLYHIFHACRLLECLFILMSSPATFTHPTLFVAIKDLFEQLLDTQNGLLFLSSRPETTNGIIRSLTQTADFTREDGAEDSPTQQLGVELVYYLQTLQYIDQLREYHQKGESEKAVDDAEPLGILHSLYTMTFIPLGRDAVVHVFSLQDNLHVLLPFMETPGVTDKELRVKKSVCTGYATELLLLIIKRCEKVDIFEKYAAKLLALSSQEGGGKMSELQDWLAPAKKISVYNYEGLDVMVELLKQYSQEISKLPRGLVTTLRILRHVAVHPDTVTHEGSPEELKYLYIIIELYSKDCLPLLMNILKKLTELMLRPWQQGIPQSKNHMLYCLSVIKPALSIVKGITSRLIQTRGAQFKDLTALPTFCELHTILCCVPTTGIFAEDIFMIQKDIIETILCYTQPPLQQTESDEGLNQSLWTQCVREVLKYTIKAPYTYYSGLLILSELLPLPFPVQTRESLTEEEITLAVNSRKLWSAHLHPVANQMLEVMRILSSSSCQALQQILRRVTLQLADLAAPTAVMITRCLVDVVMESIGPLVEVTKVKPEVDQGEGASGPPGEEKKSVVMKPASAQTAQLQELLSNLTSQAPIKAAFLQLIRESRGDDKYSSVLSRLLEILTTPSALPSHLHSQEYVVSFIQNLCDVEVTMVSADGNTTVQDQLSNALPDKESMCAIALALVEHVGHSENSYASILSCLRTLIMLTDHDYGFFYLKCGLEKSRFSLYNLMMRVSKTFSKDSADILSTLSSIVELLRLLVIPDAPAEDQPQTRVQQMTNKELREALAWEKDNTDHPLNELEKLLADCYSSKDEEALQTLQETISSLIQIIATKDEEPKPFLEPELPVADDLSQQFETRATYVVTDLDDDRLNPAYWLSNPVTEDLEQDGEVVKTDFLDLCSRHCPDFDLEGELKKATSSVIQEIELTKPRKLRERRKQDTINTSRGRGGKSQFVAPMRGRGIARGMHGSRTDSFRCRPPNTSRPPSMHVDDFVKLETRQGSSNQQGGPPQRRSEPKDMIGRGRGRGNFGGGGMDRGGGFGGRRGGNGRGGGRGMFTPPNNYGRREMDYFPGGQRGGRSNPNFNTPRMFTRAGHDNRPGSVDRRMGGREQRFTPRGGRGGNWGGAKGKGDVKFLSPGGFGFRGRRDQGQGGQGRHFRSFTR